MSSTLPAGPGMSPSRRNIAIAGGVVLFHVAALWALQAGLLRRAVEIVVPVTIMTETVAPPAPQPPAPAPPPPEPSKPQPKPEPAPPKKAVLPAPQPVARLDTPPSPRAVTGTAEPQPPAPPIAAPVAPPSPAPAPPAPPRLELPSTDADYLQNPKPAYPPMSKRLGEQGKVVLRVLIGTDGNAQKAEIKQSSGFDRLDQAGLQTVLKWRYVPGKRNGVPEAMWFDVPINFVLE